MTSPTTKTPAHAPKAPTHGTPPAPKVTPHAPPAPHGTPPAPKVAPHAPHAPHGTPPAPKVAPHAPHGTPHAPKVAPHAPHATKASTPAPPHAPKAAHVPKASASGTPQAPDATKVSAPGAAKAAEGGAKTKRKKKKGAAAKRSAAERKERTEKRAPSPKRDMAPSSFAMILERLVAATPGARGAALVDFEGETVDYAGKVDPFELKVAAATWQIALAEIEETKLAGARQITVRSRRTSFVLRRVTSDYALVLVLHSRAAFAVSERALVEAEGALAREAGWPRKVGHAWFRVAVKAGAEHRPTTLFVGEAWQPIELIGSMMGLHDRERGYRVRLPSGVEMMLVRERNGVWFCDEPVSARAHEAAEIA